MKQVPIFLKKCSLFIGTPLVSYSDLDFSHSYYLVGCSYTYYFLTNNIQIEAQQIGYTLLFEKISTCFKILT